MSSRASSPTFWATDRSIIPTTFLQTFDLVIASVHSKFRMPNKEQTDRIVKAIENPYTTILGHVTGRQLFGGPATKWIWSAF